MSARALVQTVLLLARAAGLSYACRSAAMAPKKSRKAQTERLFPESSALPSVPAAAALSFLRETRGLTAWNVGDLAKTLRISGADANRVIAILELQGYVKAAGNDGWMTTLSGEEVSGSRLPRFTRERVKQTLDDLRRRIAEINGDSRSPYKITEVVAFGDFLTGRPRVQSAEVGIALERRGGPPKTGPSLGSPGPSSAKSSSSAKRRSNLASPSPGPYLLQPRGNADSAKEHKARRAFLQKLKGKGGVLQVREFQKWMRERTHLDLQ